MNRRHFLGSALSAAGLAGLPRRAHASPADRKFVFVHNAGGWDPTRALAAEFANTAVDMEADATSATAGGITYVDHPDRPSVRSFFQTWNSRSLILNGVLVRAISHELCTKIAFTGSTSGTQPDWATILAQAGADRYTIPHLVIGGPSFAGELGALVARTGQNGQLDALLTDALGALAPDVPIPATDDGIVAAIDVVRQEMIARRLARAGPGLDASLVASWEVSAEKAIGLHGMRERMDFQALQDLETASTVAANALTLGLSRCVTLAWPTDPYALAFDSHSENDETQSPLWEDLFAGLSNLMGKLQAAPGSGGGSLADETVVVVLSEMGRTPSSNSAGGKDHWPYTSVLMVGPAVTGGRIVGAYDANYNGSPVDPATGELDASAEPLTIEMLGATLLALGDVDPEPWIDATVLQGVMA